MSTADSSNHQLLRKALKDKLAIELVDAYAAGATIEDRKVRLRQVLEKHLSERRQRLAGDGKNQLA